MNKSLDKRCYFRRSAAHSANCEFDKELVIFKRLISLDPKCNDHHLSWARIRKDKEEYRYAELKFRELVIMHPKGHRAFNNLGKCLAKQNKHEEAIVAYKKGLNIKISDELLLNLAITFTQKGDYEQASECYTKALNLNPLDELIHNCLGYSYFLQGKYEAAIEKFNDAISHDPRYCVAFFNKALVLFCQSSLEEDSKEVFLKGIFALSGENQQKVQRLKGCMRLYMSEMSRVEGHLQSPEMNSDRKNHLENLKKGFEYILDMLRRQIEEFEKKILDNYHS